nr:hypothetical protein [uncultured Bifidobacterium sp.]
MADWGADGAASWSLDCDVDDEAVMPYGFDAIGFPHSMQKRASSSFSV